MLAGSHFLEVALVFKMCLFRCYTYLWENRAPDKERNDRDNDERAIISTRYPYQCSHLKWDVNQSTDGFIIVSSTT